MPVSGVRESKRNLSIANRPIPNTALLLDETLADRADGSVMRWTDAQESARHIQQYGAALRKLE